MRIMTLFIAALFVYAWLHAYTSRQPTGILYDPTDPSRVQYLYGEPKSRNTAGTPNLFTNLPDVDESPDAQEPVLIEACARDLVASEWVMADE